MQFFVRQILCRIFTIQKHGISVGYSLNFTMIRSCAIMLEIIWQLICPTQQDSLIIVQLRQAG